MTDESQIRGLREHNEKLNKLISESLQQALILLMEKKDYRDISITELCKKAGVSRMAFYSNYETKDNLLETIVLDVNKRFIAKVGSPFRDYVDVNWYITLFNTAAEFANTLRLIFRAGFKYKYISIINSLVLHDENISDKERYTRLMWSGGITNTIINWLESGMTTQIPKIAAFCLNSFKYLE